MAPEPASESTTNDAIVSQYETYVMPIWKSMNVPVKSADGTTLRDFEGNEYLDMFSGISVVNTGHTNDRVVDAMQEQLDDLIHGCSYVHPNEPVATLAEKIADVTPGDLQKTFFCNSGTEAVEGAVKLARKYTGSKEVVALEMGFHGRTLGSLALTGNQAYKQGMAPTINDVAHAPAPYKYRSTYRDASDEAYAEAAAADVEHVVGTHTSGDLAAIVVEPVMGEAGLIDPPADYLARVKAIAHDHDALLIVDEVQSGYGRTGEFWGVDHYDVVPDILTQAKGIANGMPLGAFTASADIADAFESSDHFSTFGGNPVCCAGALATISELENGIIDNARDQSAYLDEAFAAFEADYDVVGEVRGLGLMRGIELVDPSETGPRGNAPSPDPERTKQIAGALRDKHDIIVGVGGYYKNVLRVQPPLVVEQAELDRFTNALRDELE